jgi:hypothetical protein
MCWGNKNKRQLINEKALQPNGCEAFSYPKKNRETNPRRDSGQSVTAGLEELINHQSTNASLITPLQALISDFDNVPSTFKILSLSTVRIISMTIIPFFLSHATATRVGYRFRVER